MLSTAHADGGEGTAKAPRSARRGVASAIVSDPLGRPISARCFSCRMVELS
jgi:hypothetical protein